MSGLVRCILIICAVLLFLYMIKKIRKSQIKIEATIFWLTFSFILIFIGIFPNIVYIISGMLGFQSPISMVYLIIIFVLIVKNFSTTLQVSQLENKVDELTQRIAIDRKEEKE